MKKNMKNKKKMFYTPSIKEKTQGVGKQRYDFGRIAEWVQNIYKVRFTLFAY